MKRALAIAVALCTLGVAGFSQLVFKGSWTATYCPLPVQTPTLTSTLSLTYTVGGFDITGAFEFGLTGLTAVDFTTRGAFGPFTVSGKMNFDPTVPAYRRSQLVSGFDFGGVAVGLTVNHWLDGSWDAAYFGLTGADPCLDVVVGGNLQYVFTAAIAPVSLRVRFLDCSLGTAFQDLRIIVTPIDLCCGIKLTGTFMFTKAGFDSLGLTGINIPLCCGVSFDIGITYTTTAKTLTVTPRFAGIGDACFTVWAAPTVAGTYIWDGIRVDGFRLRCTIGDCNYVEWVNVFNFGTGTAVPAAIRGLFNRAGACREFEYFGLGFCGPGCCGGRYTVDLRFFYGEDGTPDGIFGITKFTGAVKLPIMTTFTLDLSFSIPTVAACGTPSFCLGWTFTF